MKRPLFVIVRGMCIAKWPQCMQAIDFSWNSTFGGKLDGFEGHYFHPSILANYFDVSHLSAEDFIRLQKRTLERFLLYTEVLELKVVNPVFETILGTTTSLKVKSQAEGQLLKQFIVEEEVHAELARTLLRRVSGDEVFVLCQSSPNEHLKELKEKFRASGLSPEQIAFLFVFSSETLISKRLTLNSGSDMHPAVRSYMGMHLVEEGRHRNYFLLKFSEVFKSWSIEEQIASARVVAVCIRTFLKPDITSLKLDITSLNYTPALINKNMQHDYESQAKSVLMSLKNLFTESAFKELLTEVRS